MRQHRGSVQAPAPGCLTRRCPVPSLAALRAEKEDHTHRRHAGKSRGLTGENPVSLAAKAHAAAGANYGLDNLELEVVLCYVLAFCEQMSSGNNCLSCKRSIPTDTKKCAAMDLSPVPLCACTTLAPNDRSAIVGRGAKCKQNEAIPD